jgi:hypothetical protein
MQILSAYEQDSIYTMNKNTRMNGHYVT